MFVHARNETVRTSTILRDTAKHGGDIRTFLPDQNVQYGDALKNVRFQYLIMCARFSDHWCC